VGGPTSLLGGTYDRVKTADLGSFRIPGLSRLLHRDESAATTSVLSTCDCCLRRRKRPRMLAIQKMLWGGAGASHGESPDQADGSAKVSALPCVREGYVAGVISR